MNGHELAARFVAETRWEDLPAAVQGGISRNFPLSALDGNLLVAAEVRKKCLGIARASVFCQSLR